jgi:hypothetical protein
MRRIASRAAGALVLALAVSAPGTASAQQYVTFRPTDEHHAVIRAGRPGEAGRTWGYWGKLTLPASGARWGSYRATCSWLADQAWKDHPTRRDNRCLCTVILSFPQDNGSLVAQGLVRLPRGTDGLFAGASQPGGTRRPEPLAITGGTGLYESMRGYVDLGTPHIIAIIQHA